MKTQKPLAEKFCECEYEWIETNRGTAIIHGLGCSKFTPQNQTPQTKHVGQMNKNVRPDMGEKSSLSQLNKTAENNHSPETESGKRISEGVANLSKSRDSCNSQESRLGTTPREILGNEGSIPSPDTLRGIFKCSYITSNFHPKKTIKGIFDCRDLNEELKKWKNMGQGEGGRVENYRLNQIKKERQRLGEEIRNLMVGFMDLGKIDGYLIKGIKNMLEKQDREAVEKLKETEVVCPNCLNGFALKDSYENEPKNIDEIFGDFS